MKKLFGKCNVENENISLEFYILNTQNRYGIEIYSKGKQQVIGTVFNVTDDKNFIYEITEKLFKSKVLPEHLTDIVEEILS